MNKKSKNFIIVSLIIVILIFLLLSISYFNNYTLILDFLIKSLPIIISSVSLVVATTVLINNYYIKFKPEFIIGTLGFRIYPIKSGREKWYIPSFDIDINILNMSPQFGIINNFRIICNYVSVPIDNNYEVFPATFILEGNSIDVTSKERFSMLDQDGVQIFSAFIINGKDTVSKHILFESRWKSPVLQKMKISLEFQEKNKKEWIKLKEWNYEIDSFVWNITTVNGSKILIDNNKKNYEIYPNDLYKYICIDKPNPNIGKNIEPSTLDYDESFSTKRNNKDGDINDPN